MLGGRQEAMPTILQNSSKACASLRPQPREFEGIQKQYKNSAGATNLIESVPHTCSSAKPPTSQCAPKFCVSKEF